MVRWKYDAKKEIGYGNPNIMGIKIIPGVILMFEIKGMPEMTMDEIERM